MAEMSCFETSLKVKKKNMVPVRGLDLWCREAYCMVVEHSTDLLHPAKPLSYSKELGFRVAMIIADFSFTAVPLPPDLIPHL